jgi:hypothetical protein
LQNVIKVIISSSPGLTGGSSVFKDFLDSPPKRGMTEKGLIFSFINDVDHEAPNFKAGSFTAFTIIN